ncbi:MAG: prolyl oligopeptidase family serine peptidase, partial [Candidatus Thorarchaeota archaeon]
DYKGDKNAFFVFGRSAGAHLALLTAFSCDESYFEMEGIQCTIEDQKIDGVIAFYPITDMLDLFESYEDSKHLRLPIYRSTGGTPEENAEIYRIFSPVNYINENIAKRIPPVFLAAGKLDKLITVNQSLELHQELDKYGIPNVFLEFPWANHAFDLVLNGPGGQLAYKYLSQFLVWVLSQRKIKHIEEIANELGMKKIISMEKIKLLHQLNDSNEEPNSEHIMNYLKKQ